MTAGDTTLVKTDTYAENVQFWYSGGPGNYIVLKAYPGHSPIIDATGGSYGLSCASLGYIELDGLEVKNSNLYGVSIWQSGHIRLLNLAVHDNQDSGIAIAGAGATDPFLINCICYNNGLGGAGGHGIIAYDGDGVTNAGDNGELYNCVAYNNGVNPDDWASGIEWQGQDSIIQGCRAYGNAQRGFDFAGHGAHGNTIAWCWAYDNQRDGFSVNGGGYGNTFHHCVAYDNCQIGDWGAGFWIGNDADDCELYNCTSYGHSVAGDGGGIAFVWQGGTDPEDCIVKNCVTWHNAPYAYFIYDAATLLESDRNNLGEVDGDSGQIYYNGAAYATMAAYRAASGLDANSISADPLFKNAGGGDFTLQPNSPCIDAGVDVGYAYIDAAPDMGAEEYSCPLTFGSAQRRHLSRSALIKM